MARVILTLGVFGGFFIAIVASPIFGAAWLICCLLIGIFAVLDTIQALLERQQTHLQWYEKIESYRFAKQYPDAGREWHEAEQTKKMAAEESARSREHNTQEVVAAAAAVREARKEAKRKATEPTFVARELVPEIPPDFKPKSDVDFSALEEVAKPRRKRE